VTFCTPEQFEEIRRGCERLASIANAISCPTLVVSASVRPRDVDDSQIVQETASVIASLLDIVEPQSVGLAFAFRAFDWCAVNSLEQTLEAIGHHAGRQVGLALDTFDLHASGVHPDALRTLDPDRIAVLRLGDCEDLPAAILSDTDRVLPGEGVADLDAMLGALAEAGYAGDVSAKILSQRIWGIDAAEAASVIMAITRKYLPGAHPKMGTGT
jgi:sugar phosphate isomerase/epimerase